MRRCESCDLTIPPGTPLCPHCLGQPADTYAPPRWRRFQRVRVVSAKDKRPNVRALHGLSGAIYWLRPLQERRGGFRRRENFWQYSVYVYLEQRYVTLTSAHLERLEGEETASFFTSQRPEIYVQWLGADPLKAEGCYRRPGEPWETFSLSIAEAGSSAESSKGESQRWLQKNGIYRTELVLPQPDSSDPLDQEGLKPGASPAELRSVVAHALAQAAGSPPFVPAQASPSCDDLCSCTFCEPELQARWNHGEE